MKLRPTTKIALGFGIVVIGSYLGNDLYSRFQLRQVKLNPIESTDFCLMAINKKEAGVQVLIANRMAQLVETEGGLENTGSSEGGAQSGSIKLRIPIKELLQTLNGDPTGIDYFASRLSDVGNDNVQNLDEAKVWKSGDIEKAISGDAALRKQLETDLNCTLDGRLLDKVNIEAVQLGIRLAVPVRLNVPNVKGDRLDGVRFVPFKVRQIVGFSKSIEEKFYTKETLQNLYQQFKAETRETEDVASTLQQVIAGVQRSREIGKIEQIAKNSLIVVNRAMIQDASFSETSVGTNRTFNMKLKFNDEAVKRLWKFSHEGGGSLLVISNGVPIAAADVATVLNSSELEINKIADEKLCKNAVELLSR